MPTAKPRITITLEPHAHEVLTRLSGLTGDSMSAIVTQYVDLALPSLERVVVVLERARDAPQEARAGLAAAVERAERQLLPALVAASDQTHLFLADALQGLGPAAAPAAAAPAQRERRRAAPTKAAAAKDPRLVTRGSGGPGRSRKGVARG
jgi:hypothetical protein